MNLYYALVFKDESSDYSILFPDFPGCITAGSDMDEAMAMAEEALALHIFSMMQDNEPIPKPSSLENITKKSEGSTAIIGVKHKPRAIRHKRINVTFREDLLHDIDMAAEAAGMTRSGYLAYCATKVGEV